MKYKVGDRVRIRSDLRAGKRYRMKDGATDVVVGDMLKFGGETVTIMKVGATYRVTENPWNWTDEMFEGMANASQKIVITTDGKTTLARLYDGKNVIKSAEAKCSPEDTFDFMTGAKIALERLNAPEEKKPELRPGMFVRVKGGKGHSHFIADGQILPIDQVYTDDGGIDVIGYCTNTKSICRQLLLPWDYEII